MINKKSTVLLNLLDSKGSLTLEEIEAHLNISRYSIEDNLKILEEGEYIINLRNDEADVLEVDGSTTRLKVMADLYKLMPKGQAYLEFVQKDNFRFRLPIAISIIAIVISIISLIVSLM